MSVEVRTNVSQGVITAQPTDLEVEGQSSDNQETSIAQKDGKSCSFVKCAGTTVFGINHFSSLSILGVAFINSSYTLGGLGFINLCTGGIGHWMWSRFSDVSRAADGVSEAVKQAEKAADKAKIAASKGRIVADTLESAAGKVVSGAEKIEKTIGDGRSQEVQKQAMLTKEYADEILEQNSDMKAQLADFKKTLKPLLGMMGTIRSQLQDIRSAFSAGMPKIDQIEEYQVRFKDVSDVIHSDIQAKADEVREILQEMSEEAVMVLQLVSHNNKMLTEVLEEKSLQLKSALANLSQVSMSAQQSDQERQQLLRKLHIQEEDNLLLQQQISELIVSLEQELSGWETQVLKSKEGMLMLSRDIAGEKNHLDSFISRLEGFVDRLQAEPSSQLP
jgi:hypothetical protein